MLNLRTPSSPHFTSWWTIAATPVPRIDAQVLMLASAPAKSSPSPSSPGGQDSTARGTSTAMPVDTSERGLPHPARSLSNFNRLVRSYTELIEEMAMYLAGVLETRECPYEALDSSAMPVRDAKRRGAGWLAGYADIGWCNSLGWYEGFRLLCAIDPSGVITGFCFSAASAADQHVGETFFAMIAQPNRRLISVGSASSGPYVVDKGFEGAENHQRWLELYGAQLICPPKRNARKGRWPKRLRRWPPSARS